jgi:hypothetical protein
MSKNVISFTKTIDYVSDEYFPVPASQMLPEWYKNTDGYVGEKGPFTQTIKKCMPVFDAVTAGYIITTFCDIWVEISEGKQTYRTPYGSNLEGVTNLIQFHDIKQAPLHPSMNQRQYPKFINPWSIKTTKGYSLLFVPPLHHPNKYFSIFPGIVDTDLYTANVNFPFTLVDRDFEGLIPAGTPMVQVIPIKRDSWTIKRGSKEEQDKSYKDENFLNSMFFNRYKGQFWNKKEYK